LPHLATAVSGIIRGNWRLHHHQQLNKRSAFLVAAWLIDKHRAARDNRAMMKSEGM
jgi:hypothetical protein